MFGATHEHKKECKHLFSVHLSLGPSYGIMRKTEAGTG